MAGKQKATVDVLETPAARVLISHAAYAILDAVQAEGFMEHSEEIMKRIAAEFTAKAAARKARGE